MNVYIDCKRNSTVSDPAKDSAPKKLSRSGLYAGGAILAVIISVPAIMAFLVAWKVTDKMFTALLISVIIYFISTGFSFKVSKKLKMFSGWAHPSSAPAHLLNISCSMPNWSSAFPTMWFRSSSTPAGLW